MKKQVLFVTVLVFFCFFPVNIFAGGKTEKLPEGKIAVAVSFNAMKELTGIVGGDKVYIHTIIPTGMEAHDFEPKSGDLKFLTEAQILVYNGLGMEPWLEDAVEAVNRKNLLTVCASRGIEPIELAEGHHHHHHGHKHGDETGDHHDHHDEECDGSCGEDHHHHHHSGVDPHVWLSLSSAIIMVQNIAEDLGKVDPANAVFYEKNAKTFIQEAEALLTKYRTMFAELPRKHFVTGHAAFGYLCRDFGLEQSSVENVFSAGEPTAKQLAKLTDYCNQHGIKTVFSETMVSPSVSQTLAKEVGASVEMIYTMEAAEDGLSYMDRMKANLEKIYKSLVQ